MVVVPRGTPSWSLSGWPSDPRSRSDWRVSPTPSAQWTSAIAALTTSFATGQCLGPVFAGLLSDQADGVQSGMLLSAGILALGALVFLLQPPARMRK